MCGKGLVVDSLKLGEMMCFFMQKTAYDMRISDWSSYVCSSDHGDGGLALAVGADGVHLPERLGHLAGGLRRRRRNWIITQAAHGAGAVAQALRQGGADALLVSPVFPTARPPEAEGLGVVRFAALELGSASCRERVCPYVLILVVVVSFKKKQTQKQQTN